MTQHIPRIEHPELFFGFVAPIGTDIDAGLAAFRRSLEEKGYKVVDVKVTTIFAALEKLIRPVSKLVNHPLRRRYESHIAYGNQLRKKFKDNSVLAALAIYRIMRLRGRNIKNQATVPFEKIAYIIHQFKRKEEIDLLRSIYGRLFFQISLYSRRGARAEFLARRFAHSENSADTNKYKADAEAIIVKDENEADKVHGQRVSKIFHDADLVVNLDVASPSMENQISRFVDLLFGSNSVSPTKLEYGMFAAKAAALRTTDLSRQVGAAIFTRRGEIIAMGSNEVPRAGGGTYWCDEEFDDRELARGTDSNDKRKREILNDLINSVDRDGKSNLKTILNNKKIADSQFMDALEYGRIVHAEMSALSDAARLGKAVKDTILFSTTFPCHMCAKHIVASGIDEVIFLEPYPKSLASDLHSDSIQIEESDRGKYQHFPAVKFNHFYGITPRRYRELFERSKRKDEDGSFKSWLYTNPRPIIELTFPFYVAFEQLMLKGIKGRFGNKSLD